MLLLHAGNANFSCIAAKGDGNASVVHHVIKSILSYTIIMIKIVALIALSYLITPSSLSQPKQDKKLILRLDTLITRQLPSIAPGCVVLVAKKGKIVYRKSFGFANIESKKSMEPGMIFRIGSITKQFTAIAILQLVEQGKISLQDSIQKYVKDFPSKGYHITIEHLLTNTSGIKNYFEISTPSKEKTVYSPSEGVDLFKDEALLFTPGSRFQYSNSNYYLLGYIIELVSGESYADYILKNIITKVSLSNTSYINPDKPVNNMPQGYSKFDGKIETAELEEISTIYAAGGLLSNADDLFKWHQSLHEGKLVKKELFNQAISSFKLADGTLSGYGYGWYLKGINEFKTIEHSGSTDGFQADLLYLPENDIFIVTLFNCFESDMDWQILTNDIARLTLGQAINQEYHLSRDKLAKYVGTYEYNSDTKLIVTVENDHLLIRCTNPAVRLPNVKLIAEAENKFGIREVAELKFEFLLGIEGEKPKIITYNSRGKDAEWIKN